MSNVTQISAQARRLETILALPEAQNKQRQARALAVQTDLSLDTISQALIAFPDETTEADWEQSIERTKGNVESKHEVSDSWMQSIHRVHQRIDEKEPE